MAIFSKLRKQEPIMDLDELHVALKAYASGDYSIRLNAEVPGVAGEIARSYNQMCHITSTATQEMLVVLKDVAESGIIDARVTSTRLEGARGAVMRGLNNVLEELVAPLDEMVQVITALSHGDLTRNLSPVVNGRKKEGQFLIWTNMVNEMLAQLSNVAAEVSRVAKEVGSEGKLGGYAKVPNATGVWKELTDNVNMLAESVTDRVRAISEVATAVAGGDLSRTLDVEAQGEVLVLKKSINGMIQNLQTTTKTNAEQDWLKGNLARVARLLQGHHDLTQVANIVLSDLSPLLEVLHATFYHLDDSDLGESKLKLLASYAVADESRLSATWKVGQGLVGQCAAEKTRIFVESIPDDYINITSALGNSRPKSLVLLPILFEGKIKGVIELASFKIFEQVQDNFLNQVTEHIGIVINTIEATLRTEVLLAQSQSMTDELQSQQEELRATNQELEEKAQLLEEQKLEVELKNQEVEQAKSAVEEKAEQLTLTSKYKSEFLSNMSHELRTPLNSLLILAEHLADNPKDHLDEKEIEFAKSIHISGNDLLSLINEILDLSKIESGTVTLDLSPVEFANIKNQIETTYKPMVQGGNVKFDVSYSKNLPRSIQTDAMRLLQVLKNLISNSFKFTDIGKVTLYIDTAYSGWDPSIETLQKAKGVVAFTVQDSGIGISPDKQKLIFEAFQQGDGQTSRKYGGTGLGLSISREIATLLGGQLSLISSIPQGGSTFTLFLPDSSPDSIDEVNSADSESTNFETSDTHENTSRYQMEQPLADDRDSIAPGDQTLLIIEDDPKFAKIILDLAREKGFKGVICPRGSQALTLARTINFDAITLDIRIPDVDGWTILDILKRDSELRHIPVDVISVENSPIRGLSSGAFHYLVKPTSRAQIGATMDATRAFIDRPVKNLLLVTSDKEEEHQITELLKNDDVILKYQSHSKEALEEITTGKIDCVVVGSRLKDMRGTEFISLIRDSHLQQVIPVVIFSGNSLSTAELKKLEKLGTTGVVRKVDSLDRLLDQTSLFLHRVVSQLPKEKRNLLKKVQQSSNNLASTSVLVVDDDVRNIMALSAALTHRGAKVSSAENGAAGLELLRSQSKVDIVLMDIMMPTMDGYETMRRIRDMDEFKKLPIIALTAKAMVGDREKCIEAGASDYLSKPVNIEQLVSLMQVWLSK